MNEVDFLETRVRGLERENRELRLTLWDVYFSAAMTGVAACPTEPSNIPVLAAAKLADEMMAVREKRWPTK